MRSDPIVRMEEPILLQSERTINRSGGASAQTRDTCNAIMHEGHARSRQEAGSEGERL